VQSVSWSRQNDRLVFSAFDRGGWDIFAVQEPLTLDPVVARLKRNAPEAVLSLEEATARARQWSRRALAEWSARGQLAGLHLGAGHHGGSQHATGRPRTAQERSSSRWPRSHRPGEGGGFPMPAVPTHDPADSSAAPDSLATLRISAARSRCRTPCSASLRAVPLATGAEAVQLGPWPPATSASRAPRSSCSATSSGTTACTSRGDLFTNALSETNILALYNVLPRRLDWSVGVFHFKNYFQSTVTSLGENLGNEELFSERSFGGLVGWTWPFDRFRRVEFQYTQKFVEEIFFVRAADGAVQPINREYRSASTPTIGPPPGDHALWGASGPVNGSRWNITYATGLAAVPQVAHLPHGDGGHASLPGHGPRLLVCDPGHGRREHGAATSSSSDWAGTPRCAVSRTSISSARTSRSPTSSSATRSSSSWG
jgi:hypothetical protein